MPDSNKMSGDDKADLLILLIIFSPLILLMLGAILVAIFGEC